MPLLFSYGTLQDVVVQRAVFGREIVGSPDSLPGYVCTTVPIEDPAAAAAAGRDHNLNVISTGQTVDVVSGTALDVADDDLAAADAYEHPDRYDRELLTLSSGRTAWVYSHVPSRRGVR